MSDPSATRRPLTSRGKPWSWALARRLTAWRVSPNVISGSSVVWTLLAGVLFMVGARTANTLGAVLCYLGAAAGIQLRLLANLMDGMVAIEGGLGSKTGELWNDLPDRFADALVLVGAGYGIPMITHGTMLGWIAALAAIVTAYVRVLGVASGTPQHFEGPMAKPHRMATMTVAALLAAVLVIVDRQVPLAAIEKVRLGALDLLIVDIAWAQRLLTLALLVVIVGCAVTIVRRLRLIAAELRQRP